MIRRIDDHEQERRREERWARRRKRRLRTISMLPTLLTLGNLFFGFAAIYCCCREMQDLGAGVKYSDVRTLNSEIVEASAPSFLSIGFWMIAAAMLCDALDGRVARKTGAASKFGEQLDSLADAVSFGVAPALMMMILVRREFTPWIANNDFAKHYSQFAFFIGAIYACCAALRLARFNVETSLDESAHRGFKGLPSPGAAAGVVSLVCLHDHLAISVNWDRTANAFAWLLPLATLSLGLLMVSRITYVHFLSSFLRRRPFSHIIPVLFLIVFVIRYTELTVAVGSWLFILSGPIRQLWLRSRSGPPPPGIPGIAGPPPSP